MNTGDRIIELRDFEGNKVETPGLIYQPEDENVMPFATYRGRVFTLNPWSGWNGQPIIYFERPALSVAGDIA